VAAGVSLPGLTLPGGCNDSTASKAMTATIKMPGKKYRMPLPFFCVADVRPFKPQ
jgi:hypothetical protein